MKATNVFLGVILGLIVTVGLMFGMPAYNVWQQEMAGKARLAEASQSRRITVEQAIADREAATETAAAIGILGKAAKEFPEYRNQEYLAAFAEALKQGKINQIFYIPTEGGMPILEAGRAVATPSK